jgi:ribosomal protein S18 acetylase RimI-like enzyme
MIRGFNAGMNPTLQYGYRSEWLPRILTLFGKTGMKRPEEMAARMDRAFSRSQVVVSLWDGERPLAIGRMITDYEMYSAIFDVAVDPDFQRRGLGKKLMRALIAEAPGTCIHLTSTFGNEAFYHGLGFRFHKTAMALYPERLGATPYLDWERSPE